MNILDVFLKSKYDVPSLEDILKRAGKKSDDLGKQLDYCIFQYNTVITTSKTRN